VTAYADTFRLLLRFLAERRRQPIDRLGFHDLDADAVLAFLAHLEKTRGNTARTRNARLAAIRSFAHYALGQSAPDWMESAQRILAIPGKRTAKPLVGFMSREEVVAVLDAIDTATPIGRRDHLLFSLLYQTGARISEILQLQPDAVQGRFVRLYGKGRKERTVPIQAELVRQLQSFAPTGRIQSNQPYFTNRHGVRLTREAVALRLAMAVHKAAQTCPSLHGRRITPHVWRHTTAMHLLHAGVPIEVIALWLGHEQPLTTHAYVEADLTIKDRCARLLDRTPPPRKGRSAAPFSRLLSFLEAQPRRNYAQS
jgi:site-specific recombinase XerD